VADNPDLAMVANRWRDPRLPPVFETTVGPGEEYKKIFPGFEHTGFTIRNVQETPLTLTEESAFDPGSGMQAGEAVQEGFMLLDGTLSLAASALNADGTRARTRTTYRMDVRRPSLRRDQIARALVRQGVVPDLMRARTRARAMRLDDARVMRLVGVREGGAGTWSRAVRALADPRVMRFRPRTEPDGLLGHFGTAVSETGGAYVWAVLDRNSRYAVGLTVDRDGDGIPNSMDNCVGTANSNQSDADGDSAGDECDFDDDNDEVPDASDNCPLAANTGQVDLDGDGAGDACDTDDDNDAVPDATDQCLGTALGNLVDPNGCSIADLCPCDAEGRNLGAYVRCVAQASGLFVSSGRITNSEKDAIVSGGAESSCGF
jgi:hypothetical protein